MLVQINVSTLVHSGTGTAVAQQVQTLDCDLWCRMLC